ncbi:MAG: electron transfer flavoprotein subunit beta/FixA family protein [Burkholderiales bacterium]|nr:electron transfer flavoprotein subunit beta/FixA family protein [Burkholderiales bacterium]MDE1925849.1 electron transfer flavoprotein subunit beta/FixA family protein [Burkholderiales bacterium]MDE2159457.1 electron transfer flavoprotein subunit beta/FixA family protein [Burkholderiales bacterium]MDE2503060.1 electron transfer flavoprotein subunit beta/FixA family protein [Burkholderiales bacterium]
MKILIPVKRVASLEEDFEIRADGLDVDAEFINWDLNEWDDYSLEAAVLLKEAGRVSEVCVATVGPEEADEVLRKCLAKGADRAIRIWDEALAGADSIAIARVLAALARRERAELVLTGAQASDHAHGSTGTALAALLDRAHAAVVTALDIVDGRAVVQRELEGGLLHEQAVALPAVLTIQLGIAAPRYASLRGIKQAAAHPIEVTGPRELGLPESEIGAPGSLSYVRSMALPTKSRAQLIVGSPAEQAARIAAIIREVRGD